uniref:Reverse transcriptase Ty1/copia-type domain-containing protein n=1 Tax=Tanacetum cinerariifolium TaxID=118510 RepID=A0A6L2MUF8_TANCI|nr:hypothetical protein [Tanacetum cinerariifolium]
MNGDSFMINYPLYIASSDHPGMVLTITPFNGSKFHGWNRNVRMALGARLKLGFIDGSCPKPSVEDVDLQRWIRCDYMVTCWIMNSIVTELSDVFLGQMVGGTTIEGLEMMAGMMIPCWYKGKKRKKQSRMAATVSSRFDDHISADTPFDMGNENKIGTNLGGGFDKRLVAVVCQEMMKMFKGKGVDSGTPRDYKSIAYTPQQNGRVERKHKHLLDTARAIRLHAIKDTWWVRAMEDELATLERNETWTITSLLKGHKTITSKWVIKTKYKPDGNVERLKARLVVKGFNHQEALHYKNTFSLVAKLATFRVLIALATAKQWSLHQLDNNNAFLHGYIDEEIYMLPHEGYTKASPGQVCKLSRSLYCLTQTSRQWNHELTRFLVSLGYVQYKHDYSLFVKTKREEFMDALVYVDDMLITGNSEVEINALKHSLDQKFTIKDLGLAKYFLGIELCKTDTAPKDVHMQATIHLLEYLKGHSLVSWKTKKQATVSGSSTEAVYMNKVQEGFLQTTFIPTHLQLADVMTKALGQVQHNFLVDKLRLTEAPT